jgi:ligand-binding sensor domain-containing protein
MKSFYLLLALFFCLRAHTQWFTNTSTFTTQQGLSNNTVTCLQKDPNGFIWIGTHEGLNRYDGTEFINVLSNTKNNLPSNNITRIAFVNNTTLAVGTSGGICLLNTTTQTGIKLELPYNPRFSNTAFYIDDVLWNRATQQLWVCTWHGIFVYNEQGVLLQKLMGAEADMSISSFARNLFRDAHNRVYFFSQQRNGFFYPDFRQGTLIPAEKQDPYFPYSQFLKRGLLLRMATRQENENELIFSRQSSKDVQQIFAYENLATGRRFIDTIITSHLEEKRLFNAFPLSDSIFLVNSYFGQPLIYNRNSKQLNAASDNPLWFASWPDGLTVVVLKDSSDIWIGTSKGLIQSSLRTNNFKNNPKLVAALNANKGLVSYRNGFFKDDQFWLACMGIGVFSASVTTGKVQSYFNAQTPEGLRRKMVSTYLYPAGGNFWLFSVYGPIQINPSRQNLSLIIGTNKDPAFDDDAGYPFVDHKGGIWATIPAGITRYDTTTKTFTNYYSRYTGGRLPVLRTGPKTEDKKGNIWSTRQDTLVKWNVATDSFSFSLIQKEGRAVKPVTSIASDGTDILYMAIEGSFGIYHISSGNLELYTKQTGIVSTVINEIISDAEGNAWIATEGGLVFYNKKMLRFSSFTRADGLPDDEVIGLNFADPQQKTLFLGFAKTYSLLSPRDFLLDKSVPKNIITRVEVNGQPVNSDGSVLLSYKQNDVTFWYTGINFNQGRDNNYACMLEGFDQDWKYPGQERKINYINLPPGSYTFKVKTANHQGEWNEKPAIFRFEIAPPFWQRWWFIGLLICAVVTGIYYFIKKREASIRRANSIKLQMSELRMQALRAQMNPHFIFNSLNSIQNYILSNNTIDAAGYLSKFAKLMRRILDQSKHNFLPLVEVIETLRMYVEIEAFRFNHEFTYTITMGDEEELQELTIPPMLLQPFTENAILHGLMPKKGQKQLTIDCRLSGNEAVIIIDDNGIGRTQHQEKAGHTSQGEKLTAGMLESLQQLRNSKATIEIIDKKTDGQPSGTTVKVVLPIN